MICRPLHRRVLPRLPPRAGAPGQGDVVAVFAVGQGGTHFPESRWVMSDSIAPLEPRPQVAEATQLPEKTVVERDAAASLQTGMASRKSRRRPNTHGALFRLWNSLMKLLRRIHLYAGLLMLPWVLLYGFTALLFNHSTFFPAADTQIHRFRTVSEPGHELPAPAQLAELVVAQLNEKLASGDTSTSYRLVNPETAAFTRQASATVRTDDTQYRVFVDLATGRGYVREQPRNQEDEEEKRVREEAMTPLQRGQTVSVEVGAQKDRVRRSVEEAIGKIGVPIEDLAFRSLPAIEFDLQEDGTTHRVRFVASRQRSSGRASSSPSAPGVKPTATSTSKVAERPPEPDMASTGSRSDVNRATPQGRVNGASGAEQTIATSGLSSAPAEKGDAEAASSASKPRARQPTNPVRASQSGRVSIVGGEPGEMGWRRYLLRLHMAHGYPVQQNARWYWAIAVDAMFATMVFWGLSGVLMWWQIKRTRLWGALCLVLSSVAATWLAIGMHAQLIR